LTARQRRGCGPPAARFFPRKKSFYGKGLFFFAARGILVLQRGCFFPAGCRHFCMQDLQNHGFSGRILQFLAGFYASKKNIFFTFMKNFEKY
jgi:hypothetical protein